MQERLQAAQANLATKSFQASVAGGAVVATVNGQGQLTDLKLDAEFLKEDAGVVGSTIISAVTQAQNTATKASEEIMGAVGGGLGGAFKGLMG